MLEAVRLKAALLVDALWRPGLIPLPDKPKGHLQLDIFFAILAL
jgi:hypothetical protein